MTAHDKFFQEKQAAAVLKHGILKRYPDVFTAKTGSAALAGKVVYLDGFAGPGRYKPEEGQAEGAEGSPLLAVRTATKAGAFHRTLHCVFVERDPEYFENLSETLAREAPQDMVYEVLRGDVNQHLDTVLALARDSPLLAFLDPFGTGLPYTEMTDRLLRQPKWPATEVLLNFNLQSVWRIGGLLDADKANATSPALVDAFLDEEWLPVGTGRGGRASGAGFQSADASLARIDAFLGDDWWREVFRTARRQAEGQGERAAAASAAWKVAQVYCKKIEKDTGYRAFPVPIRREPGQAPLFMMILFYRYAGAPYVFNEAVSKANEDWRKFTNERSLRQPPATAEPEDLFGGTLVSEMVAGQNARTEAKLNQSWIDVIAANITEFVLTRGSAGVQDHTEALYGATLGLAREMHLREAWDQLAGRGVVRPRLKGKGNKIENQTIVPT